MSHDFTTFSTLVENWSSMRCKGHFNLSNQLFNFAKNWGIQSDRAEFREFHEIILPHFCYSPSGKAIIPNFFSGKRVKFLEIGLETMICGK